ncbi:NAD(P)-dependent oxidoreductase [Lacibacter sediminis]|uniref:Alanine dehydrogenase n=1 Tax=Lacibacter sediminis TaxID=2760713 RepID=A0A7G5XBW8_9BACT|nr:NAD(P)-dependent oxidoreductase [Lacibacter sediminis]QNA42971.1 alanine dehydrogenase [Lacibacter sediminis]
MLTIGLIREGKTPADNRVALTPAQCKWIHKNAAAVKIVVQSSPQRCFTDKEYRSAGIEVIEDMSHCDVLFGIKEVPVEQLIPNKTYLFFSHTKKAQLHNQKLMQTMVEKKITLIDYECLTHDDGQRIIGFGFFAGVVGAHNGMMAFGNRTGAFKLGRVGDVRDYRQLIHTYFGLKLPKIKIAITGSGRVAHGLLEIMNLLGVNEVEPFDYLHRQYEYPVYVHLKGRDLYERKDDGTYNRDNFHEHPEEYKCSFSPFVKQTDILLNGVYWDKTIPSLFSLDEFRNASFNIQTIADITNDTGGSIPINIGDSTIADPVYGVDKITLQKTAPYLPTSVDVMAVGNLPNELPRDASRYFGEQLIKYVLEDLVKGSSTILDRATMLRKGILMEEYSYLKEYAGV